MWPVGLQIAVLLACADASLTLRPRRIILPGIRLLAARLPSRQTHPHCIRHIFSTAAIAAESNDQGLPPLQNPSEPLSALERIKRAKAYKRSGGTSEAVNTAASGADEVAEPGFNETDIQEIEKLEGEEMYSSQFSNIKSTIENMETLEEVIQKIV
ncbi:hypothetical protein AAMO2058_001165500 [Amorphochlora amoebiformis]